jgi:hypothetical protein
MRSRHELGAWRKMAQSLEYAFEAWGRVYLPRGQMRKIQVHFQKVTSLSEVRGMDG